jgi:hypothetical protein
MKQYVCLIFCLLLLASCEKVSIINNPVPILDNNISIINLALNLQNTNVQSTEISNVVPNKVWQAVVTKKKYVLLTSVNELGEILQSDFSFDKEIQLPENIYNYIQLHHAIDGTPQGVEVVIDPMSKQIIQYKLLMFSKNLLFDSKGNYRSAEALDTLLENPSWVYGDYAKFPNFIINALNKADLYLDYVSKYYYFFLHFEDSITKQPYYLIKIANRLPNSDVTYLRVDYQGNAFYQSKYFVFDKGFRASTKTQLPAPLTHFLDQKFSSWDYDHSILKYGEINTNKSLPIAYFVKVNLDTKRNCSITCTNVGEVINYSIATKISQNELPIGIINELNAKYNGWVFSKAESRDIHGSYYTPDFYVEIKQNNETYACFYRYSPTQQLPYTLMYSYKK